MWAVRGDELSWKTKELSYSEEEETLKCRRRVELYYKKLYKGFTKALDYNAASDQIEMNGRVRFWAVGNRDTRFIQSAPSFAVERYIACPSRKRMIFCLTWQRYQPTS